MATYVKKNIPGNYITLKNELDSTLHSDIGTTYKHYLNNWWVLLNEEQIKFHEDNPEASVKEVINITLNETENNERNIDHAKTELIRMVDLYDKSTSVNGFVVNDVIDAWFTPVERTNYKASVDAAKLLGISLLSFYIGDIKFNITPEDAERMLAQIQLYADKCFMVTQQHKINILLLETIEAVDEYDYMSGYPEKLKFAL